MILVYGQMLEAPNYSSGTGTALLNGDYPVSVCHLQPMRMETVQFDEGSPDLPDLFMHRVAPKQTLPVSHDRLLSVHSCGPQANQGTVTFNTTMT